MKAEGRIMRLIKSREALRLPPAGKPSSRKSAAEGGCGVIGIASSTPIAGRHLLQSLIQMRNRGNGKGGGAALAGLQPEAFQVSPEVLSQDFLLTLAYLDKGSRSMVEASHIEKGFEIDGVKEFSPQPVEGLTTTPPLVVTYLVRPSAEALDAFSAERGLKGQPGWVVEEEFVYQNSYSLNREYYASLGEKQAFVLSHGKDLIVFKLVAYGDDVFRAYQLEDMRAHVWIGHHRYPTKGRVWHPGGAHPFVGLQEALVHNGDFANYASVCTYLEQFNIHPLFLTDTEVSVLMFDLLHRTFRYPLEYVIEALAPTTERDFVMLPESKQGIYRMLQQTHIHGSPDGPWFFLIAQSAPGDHRDREVRLLGITDTSMLRPQVFALQSGGDGEPSIGFAASEKQAIDAALESLSKEDPRFWPRADRYWNARGGSHTDGGAFLFSVKRNEAGEGALLCTDKFGNSIQVEEVAKPVRFNSLKVTSDYQPNVDELEGLTASTDVLLESVKDWDYRQGAAFLKALEFKIRDRGDYHTALEVLCQLYDRRYPLKGMRRSSWLTMLDGLLGTWGAAIETRPNGEFVHHSSTDSSIPPPGRVASIVLDARGFSAEGDRSLAREVVRLFEEGYSRIVVLHTRGQRFIGNGLGEATGGIRIDVFGSSGDYLASGIDGAEIVLHGSGQDQLAQIMKSGRLIVHGDVGQTFMYGAKGGEAYVLGNAAGRPLINAVGKPRVVINGTCLDYLAESFMAGDALDGGGFVILNGVAYDHRGELVDLPTPYPGGNLFSLASGGAIFVRDPAFTIGEDQLNGGVFGEFQERHWSLIRPYLVENERIFGIEVDRLLSVHGEHRNPEEVYRVILPSGHTALQPEQAWVTHD